jgi:hypothetical protein
MALILRKLRCRNPATPATPQVCGRTKKRAGTLPAIHRHRRRRLTAYDRRGRNRWTAPAIFQEKTRLAEWMDRLVKPGV